MEKLNKWIIRYLALEIVYVIAVMIILIVFWIFQDQFTYSNSWLIINRNARHDTQTFLYISFTFACFVNMVGAVVTLLFLLRKNRPAITMDNFIGAGVNLIVTLIFSPFILQAVFQLVFASRVITRT